MIPPRNADLKNWRTASRLKCAVRDFLAAAVIAAVCLGASFAAGVFVELLKGNL